MKKTENLKGKFILWKYKDHKTYSKKYVQDVVETIEGKTILEFSDGDFYTAYPLMVCTDAIDILIPKE